MADSIRLKFSAEDYSIDKYSTTALHVDDATGCLLSTPPTTIYSKMQLSRPRQDSSSPISSSQPHMRDKNFERRVVPCRQASRELQHRLTGSISSTDCNPRMTDDPFASPTSDTFLKDLSHNPSAVDVASEKLWREYPLEDVTGSLFETPSYTNYASELRIYDNTEDLYSPRSRSPVTPEIFQPCSSELHRSDAVHFTRDRSGTINAPKPQPLYYAFPPAVTNPHAVMLPPKWHQSLPHRTDSRITQRPRAKTEPSQCGVSMTSNLNVCVPANNDIYYISSTSNIRGQRSAPPTPLALPTDIVDQYVVSQFDDDDDEDDNKSDFFASLSRLCRRGSSNASGSLGKRSTIEKQKKHPRKSLSETLKGCFGKCK